MRRRRQSTPGPPGRWPAVDTQEAARWPSIDGRRSASSAGQSSTYAAAGQDQGRTVNARAAAEGYIVAKYGRAVRRRGSSRDEQGLLHRRSVPPHGPRCGSGRLPTSRLIRAAAGVETTAVSSRPTGHSPADATADPDRDQIVNATPEICRSLRGRRGGHDLFVKLAVASSELDWAWRGRRRWQRLSPVIPNHAKPTSRSTKAALHLKPMTPVRRSRPSSS